MATLSLVVLLLFGYAGEGQLSLETRFLAKLDQQPLLVNGREVSRVARDDEGRIIRLCLDELQFVPEDWVAIEDMKDLESLSLRKTNVSNDDLKFVTRLPKVRFLVLSSTELTDPVVEHLARIPALRTACISDSLISPAAIQDLQATCPKLILGHSVRR